MDVKEVDFTSTAVVVGGGGVLISWQTGTGEVGVIARTLHVVDTDQSSWVQYTSIMTGTVIVRNSVHTNLTAVPVVY